VSEKEKEILGKYPNTYTFSKSLAERTLRKRIGNIKVAIVRPSIVISAYSEPMLGWTETLSAMGGLAYATMLGLMDILYAKDT
jgi:nucleoside-diphosphate-sugar epimerase